MAIEVHVVSRRHPLRDVTWLAWPTASGLRVNAVPTTNPGKIHAGVHA